MTIDWGHTWPTVLAAFLASMVEFVEALSVVLAVGTVRGWRGALFGCGSALGILVVIVAALGPALTRVPINVVQIVVGTLLLLFGLRWLRKAVLRAAGVLPFHDEVAAFAKQSEALRLEGSSGPGVDRVAVFTAFQITMLEGLEVVFIVVAVGAGGVGMLVPASLGTLAALVLVAALGVILHRPLATIPENAMKFGVGVLLSGFGTFWVGEGASIGWPGGDCPQPLRGLSLRRTACRLDLPQGPTELWARCEGQMRVLKTALKELLGLFVDDGAFALSILAWCVAAWVALPRLPFAPELKAIVFFVGFAIILVESAWRRSRR